VSVIWLVDSESAPLRTTSRLRGSPVEPAAFSSPAASACISTQTKTTAPTPRIVASVDRQRMKTFFRLYLSGRAMRAESSPRDAQCQWVAIAGVFRVRESLKRESLRGSDARAIQRFHGHPTEFGSFKNANSRTPKTHSTPNAQRPTPKERGPASQHQRHGK